MQNKIALKFSSWLILIFTYFLLSCKLLLRDTTDERFLDLLNQTSDGIYIFTDTLPKEKKVNLFDTVNKNGVILIHHKYPYIYKYRGMHDIVFPEARIKNYKANKIDTISFYFINEKDINQPLQALKKNGKIRKYQLCICDFRVPSMDTISLNLIYIFPDSIVLRRDYYY